MGIEYQQAWAAVQVRRRDAERRREEVLAVRLQEDARREADRQGIVDKGVTDEDLERWCAENLALLARRRDEDVAWALTLAEWADEDRQRRLAWAAENPRAARALEGL